MNEENFKHLLFVEEKFQLEKRVTTLEEEEEEEEERRQKQQAKRRGPRAFYAARSSRTRNEWCWAPEIREKRKCIYIYVCIKAEKKGGLGVNAAKKGTPWRFEIELR